jgi:hypothetical protein
VSGLISSRRKRKCKHINIYDTMPPTTKQALTYDCSCQQPQALKTASNGDTQSQTIYKFTA